MKIVRYDESHAGRWDEFCLNHPFAWLWHTSARMLHALDCSFSVKTSNRSFFLEENGRIAAIVPLTVDDHADAGEGASRQMSYGGFFVPSPLVGSALRKTKANSLYKSIFQEVDRIAAADGVSRLVMRVSWTPGYGGAHPYANLLTGYGFNDISLSTQVVDLRLAEEELFADFDENHRRAVKKGRALLTTEFYDRGNITHAIFETFREFYFHVAGKATRPANAFEVLYRQLCADLAVLGVTRHEGRPVGCVLAVHYKGLGYYMLGANERDFEPCPVAHVAQWDMMRRLKAKGVAYYEMGIQRGDGLFHDHPSDKDKGISRFKRGFGGFAVPMFIGEKFYSAECLEKTFQSRLERCKARVARLSPVLKEGT